VRVFKSSYRNRNGKTTKTRNWYVEFRDHNHDTRRLPAFTSKGASEELGRNLDKLVSFHRATGGQIDPTLQKWLEQIPPAVLDKLVAIGLVDTERVAVKKPLSTHLDDYATTLRSKDNSEKYVRLARARIERVFEGCGFRYWGDLSASKILSFLGDLRKPKTEGKVEVPGISAATFNYHLGALKSFCRWMVKDRRATASPVSHLGIINVRTDRRHDRRALSENELRRLIDAAKGGAHLLGRVRKGDITWSMTGNDRAMLYRLAVESGLRAGELRSLTPTSFGLDSELPTVSVLAAYSKRRRDDILPLLDSTTKQLREYLKKMEPNERVFKLPPRQGLAEMLRTDLEAAGIPYRDASNRVVDFHALRHTFISNLAAGGVHPKTAQVLARHSTITLTMDRYSHTGRAGDAAALGALPDLDAAERTNQSHGKAEKPANDDSVFPSCLARTGRFRESEGDSGRLNTASSSHSPNIKTHGKNLENSEIQVGPVGFEPTQRFKPLTDFKSATSASSVTGPKRLILREIRPSWRPSAQRNWK